MGQRAASAGVRDDTLYQHDALYRESYDRAAASRTGGAQQTGSHWDGKLVPDSGTSFDTSSKGFAWAVVIGGFVLFIGIVNILDRASQYPLGAPVLGRRAFRGRLHRLSRTKAPPRLSAGVKSTHQDEIRRPRCRN